MLYQSQLIMKSFVKWCSTSYKNWRIESRQTRMTKLYEKKSYQNIPKLFRDHSDYAEITWDGFPFTYFLVSEGNRNALEVFLKGISFRDHLPLDDNNPFKANLLAFAYLENQIEIVELLQDQGFSIGVLNSQRQNLLHLAAIYRRRQAFMNGLKKKVDHNLEDLFGNTPLHYACRVGQTQFVEALLAGKAQKIGNKNHQYPIHMAIESLNLSVVELLKKDLWLKYPMSHPIHSAARVGACQIMKRILQKEPTLLNIRDHKKLTPLHHAVATENSQSLGFLLRQNQILVNMTDSFGNTPLHIAFMRDDIQTAQKLITAKANLDLQNDDYLTPVDLGLDSSSQRTQIFIKTLIPKSKRLQQYNSKQ